MRTDAPAAEATPESETRPRASQDPVFIVGSFPPVTGSASSACIAAVRRAWAAGDEVVTASLRPGAADTVARVSGLAAGFRLERARLAAGQPRRLVLGLDDAQLGRVPASTLTSRWHRLAAGLRIAGTIAGLIRPLEHFENVSILLTSRLHGPQPLLRMLWRHVDSVLVAPGSESIARDSWVPPSMVSTTESYPVSGATAGVTSLGPPEIPREVWLREQSTRVVVVVLRRLLGRYYVPIRIQAGKVAGLIRRQSRRR